MKFKKYFLIFLILFTHSTFLNGQIKSISGQAGFGIIEGNIPTTYSWNTSIGLDLQLKIVKEIKLRFSFLFGEDINGLLPDERISKHYPSIKGVSIKILAEQPLSELFFIEEGIGLLMLNDKTFIDRDEMAYGVIFSGIIGYKLNRNIEEESGISIGLGLEYGITFTNNSPSVGSTFILVKYSF